MSASISGKGPASHPGEEMQVPFRAGLGGRRRRPFLAPVTGTPGETGKVYPDGRLVLGDQLASPLDLARCEGPSNESPPSPTAGGKRRAPSTGRRGHSRGVRELPPTPDPAA